MRSRKLVFAASLITILSATTIAPALAERDDHRDGQSDRRHGHQNHRDFDRSHLRDRDGHSGHHSRGHNRERDRGGNVAIYLGQNFGQRHYNHYDNHHRDRYWPARSYGHRHRDNYTLIGFMFGGYPAYGMTPYDYGYAANVFELTPTRQTVAWQNPDSGVGYQLTPVRTYQVNNGQYCREYQATAVIGGRAQGTFGTACRTDDGSWRIMN